MTFNWSVFFIALACILLVPAIVTGIFLVISLLGPWSIPLVAVAAAACVGLIAS